MDAWDSSPFATWQPCLSQVTASAVGDLIVIGVVNTERSRDMLPVGVSKHLGGAGADAFVRFLSQELVPWVEKRYRSDGRRVLFGRSDSGLLAMYAFATAPEAFTSYIASSPTLGRCSRLILEGVERTLVAGRTADRSLYVTYGERDTPFCREPMSDLTAVLRGRSPGSLRWVVKQAPGQSHNPTDALKAGLRFVFQSPD